MHHFDKKPDKLNETLYVITPVFNAPRYNSRWNLYEQFAKHVEDSGAKLFTVEVAFGNRQHAITSPDNPMQLQLRTDHELWHKEAMINLAIQRLPNDWRKFCWIDSDLLFTNPKWVSDTLHSLEHYDIVQMFSEAIDLDPNYNPHRRAKGFVWCLMHEEADRKGAYAKQPYLSPKGYTVFHSGFAWAARREALNRIGGLLDFSILGSADKLMAQAFANKIIDTSLMKDLPEAFKKKLQAWQERAYKAIIGNIGYVDGLILHYWHGAKSNRQYGSRTKILRDANFDPDKDLIRDWQGLWQLSGNNAKLRDGLRKYFKDRNEDCIFVPENENHFG